jgi:hypothetical protein
MNPDPGGGFTGCDASSDDERLFRSAAKLHFDVDELLSVTPPRAMLVSRIIVQTTEMIVVRTTVRTACAQDMWFPPDRAVQPTT